MYKLFTAECLQGKVLISGTKRMTLTEFYEYWSHHFAKEHLQITTCSINRKIFERIEATLGHLKIDKITPKKILEFIDQLKQPNASIDDNPYPPPI
jgi:hypothetical protein